MMRSHSGGKVYRYPKIVVCMTDRDVILRAANLFGNAVYIVPMQREEQLQQYRAQISGSKAAELMEQLLPEMGARRSAKIKEIIEEYNVNKLG